MAAREEAKLAGEALRTVEFARKVVPGGPHIATVLELSDGAVVRAPVVATEDHIVVCPELIALARAKLESDARPVRLLNVTRQEEEESGAIRSLVPCGRCQEAVEHCAPGLEFVDLRGLGLLPDDLPGAWSRGAGRTPASRVQMAADATADRNLIEHASNVLERSYLFGRHHVAAAVRTEQSAVLTGLHTTFSPGIGVCAEMVALGAAAADGERVETIVAVRKMLPADRPAIVSPCGICRELIRYRGQSIRVLVADVDGRAASVTAAELLPYPFIERAASTVARGARLSPG